MSTSERIRRDASERSPTDSHELNLTVHIRNAFSSESPGCGAVPPARLESNQGGRAVPSTVHRPPSTVHRPPSAVHRLASIVHRPSSIVHRPSSIVHRPPSTVYRPYLPSRIVSSRVSSRGSSRLVQSLSVPFRPVPFQFSSLTTLSSLTSENHRSGHAPLDTRRARSRLETGFPQHGHIRTQSRIHQLLVSRRGGLCVGLKIYGTRTA